MIITLINLILCIPILIILNVLDLKNKKLRFYGIKGFYGLAGKGKTMAMTQELLKLRQRYKDKILIATNYNLKCQDFELKTWEQILIKYDKPLIIGWDELPNEFNSRDFKNFPISLLTILTQQRKGNGIMILFTSQRFTMVDKNFRILSNKAIECNTIANWFTICHEYETLDYEDKLNKTDVNLKIKIRPKRTYSFLQSQKMRDSYDSFKMLESAKSKQYLDREELALLNNNNDIIF